MEALSSPRISFFIMATLHWSALSIFVPTSFSGNRVSSSFQSDIVLQLCSCVSSVARGFGDKNGLAFALFPRFKPRESGRNITLLSITVFTAYRVPHSCFLPFHSAGEKTLVNFCERTCENARGTILFYFIDVTHCRRCNSVAEINLVVACLFSYS